MMCFRGHPPPKTHHFAINSLTFGAGSGNFCIEVPNLRDGIPQRCALVILNFLYQCKNRGKQITYLWFQIINIVYEYNNVRCNHRSKKPRRGFRTTQNDSGIGIKKGVLNA